MVSTPWLLLLPSSDLVGKIHIMHDKSSDSCFPDVVCIVISHMKIRARHGKYSWISNNMVDRAILGSKGTSSNR